MTARTAKTVRMNIYGREYVKVYYIAVCLFLRNS